MAIYLGDRIGIQPTMLTITPMFESEGTRNYYSNENSLANLNKVRQKNVISVKAQKKIRSAINWLVHAAYWKPVWKKDTGSIFYFKLNFVTLTLNSFYSDRDPAELTELLFQPFLSYARQYWNLRNYIWRVEKTEAGTIHWHFTGDTFIHWRRLQKQWNAICRKKGFHSCYADKGDKYEPNSIDVHFVNNSQNLGAELCKYMSKSDEQSTKIEGRLWGCSYSLSKAHNTSCTAERGTPFYDLVRNLASTLPIHFVERVDKMSYKKITIATLLFPSARDWLDKRLGLIKTLYDDVILLLRSGIEPSDLIPIVCD
jgi:hypothetical protein